jgi:hypothetical protein
MNLDDAAAPVGADRLLKLGCPGCGDRKGVPPGTALRDAGWRFDMRKGWLCPRCVANELSGSDRP